MLLSLEAAYEGLLPGGYIWRIYFAYAVSPHLPPNQASKLDLEKVAASRNNLIRFYLS